MSNELLPAVVLESVETAITEGDLVAASDAIGQFQASLESRTLNEKRLLKQKIDRLLELAIQQRKNTKQRLKSLSAVSNASAQYKEIAGKQ